MKKLFYLIVVCFLQTPVSAQTYVVMVRPGAGMWGYANIKGEMILPAKYSNCQSFSADGYAAYADVKLGRFYLIDLKGEMLKTQFPTFKLLVHPGFVFDSFHNGMIPVSIDKTWGYMGTDGKLKTPLVYDNAYEFSDGYGIVTQGDQFGIVDSTGKVNAVADQAVSQIRKFSEGLAPYRNETGEFGFIGPDGKIVIQATFESVGYFHGGKAWAKSSDRKVGFIDKEGKWIIKPILLVAHDFDEKSGLAMVRLFTKKWVYVNDSGKTLTPPEADVTMSFSDGLALGKKDGMVGYFDNKGAWVIPPKFEVGRDFRNGYAAVRVSGAWGVIAKDGTWVIKPSFAAIKDMELVP